MPHACRTRRKANALRRARTAALQTFRHMTAELKKLENPGRPTRAEAAAAQSDWSHERVRKWYAFWQSQGRVDESIQVEINTERLARRQLAAAAAEATK